MASPFPSNPSNGDTFDSYGRTYEYSSVKSAWHPVSRAPKLGELTDVDTTGISVGQDLTYDDVSGEYIPGYGAVSRVVATMNDLPVVKNNFGDLTFVQSNNRLYMWRGSAWTSVALVNTSPTITVGPNSAYSLAADGTPTIITLEAEDPEGIPITWGYNVTSGSLEDTTIDVVGNEFTITPGTIGTSFNLTFTASDTVNIATAVSSFTMPFVNLLYTLDNPNAYGTSATDLFGSNIAMSNGYLIVGVPAEDAPSATSSGKSYIFNATTGTFVVTLNNPNAYGTGQLDTFGQAVSISGSHALVGAYQEDDANGTESGKVYIYRTANGTWSDTVLRFTINNPGPSPTTGHLFGISVSFNKTSNYCIIGARGVADGSNSVSGRAYIYRSTNGTWSDTTLVRTLLNPNAYGTSQGDYYGQTVVMSGNYAAVSAFWEDDANGSAAGKVYIYKTNNGLWADAVLVYTLDNPDTDSTTANEYFGENMVMNGNFLFVGMPGADSATTASVGKVYMYDVTTGTLIHSIENPNSYGTPSDAFGSSLDSSGNYLIVGANAESEPSYTFSGKAYIFKTFDGTWTDTALVHTIDNPNAVGTSASDRFGNAVAIENNYAAVAAYYEDDTSYADSGKAYIFSFN